MDDCCIASTRNSTGKGDCRNGRICEQGSVQRTVEPGHIQTFKVLDVGRATYIHQPSRNGVEAIATVNHSCTWKYYHTGAKQSIITTIQVNGGGRGRRRTQRDDILTTTTDHRGQHSTRGQGYTARSQAGRIHRFEHTVRAQVNAGGSARNRQGGAGCHEVISRQLRDQIRGCIHR